MDQRKRTDVLNMLSFENLFQLLLQFIYGVGGPIAIILVISKYVADHLFDSRLKSIESKHSKELEETKSELEKAKNQFFRYSEEQFKLYNNLWKVLIMTKSRADELWEDATPEKIPSFAEQIRLTRKAVMDSMLLIEEEHYDDLDNLLDNFEKFQIGKEKLIDIRSNEQNEIDEQEVISAIDSNRHLKIEYTKLIMKIGSSFRKQIKG